MTEKCLAASRKHGMCAGTHQQAICLTKRGRYWTEPTNMVLTLNDSNTSLSELMGKQPNKPSTVGLSTKQSILTFLNLRPSHAGATCLIFSGNCYFWCFFLIFLQIIVFLNILFTMLDNHQLPCEWTAYRWHPPAAAPRGSFPSLWGLKHARGSDPGDSNPRSFQIPLTHEFRVRVKA